MTDDGKKEKGFELRDDDALPQRLQLAQRLTDILATARCPVIGHSLRETLGPNPPLFSIDSSLLLNDIHEGGTKKVETTPNRNSKKNTKPPTQSPGMVTSETEQRRKSGKIDEQQWELMKTQAGAVIRQQLSSIALADLTGIKCNEPKKMIFAISGLSSEDPQDQVDEIMDEINEVKLTNPLDFTQAWADIAAMKTFMDGITGTKVSKKKWARKLAKKFSTAFPTVKQQMKQRQIIEGKALKADEVVKLAKIDYNEAKEDKKNKRKQAKEQAVMVQKLDMQAAKRHRQGLRGGPI